MIAIEITLLDACLLNKNMFQISLNEKPRDQDKIKMTIGTNNSGDNIPTINPLVCSILQFLKFINPKF